MFVRNFSHLQSGRDRMNIDDNNNDKLHFSELLIKKNMVGGEQ